jgi:Protein of unknown function (DUF3592)
MSAMIILGLFGVAANQMSPQMAALCLGGFGLILLLVGVALSINTVRQLKQAQASNKWPSISGSITSAFVDVETKTERVQNSGRKHSYRTRTRTTYTPKIQFAYAVGGASYSSDQRVIGGNAGFGSREAADGVIEKYPLGRTVTVYYDPADPKDGVLEPGVSGALVPWLVAACFG